MKNILPPRGIYNPRSICYFIVVVQTLASLDHLKSYLSNYSFNPSTFTSSLKELLFKLQKPGKSLFDCNYFNLLKLLNDNSIDPKKKNCADELLVSILRKLKEETVNKNEFEGLFKCMAEGDLDCAVFIGYNTFLEAVNGNKTQIINQTPVYLIVILSNTGPTLSKFYSEEIFLNNQTYNLKVKCLFGKKYLLFDHYTAIIKTEKYFYYDDESVKEFKNNIWIRNKKITYLVYEKL